MRTTANSCALDTGPVQLPAPRPTFAPDSRRKRKGGPPLFFVLHRAAGTGMITEQQMRAIVQHQLEGTSHFLVDVEVRPGDKVVVEVDDPQAITLEQLVQLNRAIRAAEG